MFVAINYITCQEEYKPRFESLFLTRAHAIDRMPGFLNMQVLKPVDQTADYLIVSHWESEESFKDWTGSAEFGKGINGVLRIWMKPEQPAKNLP